ncbi:MgtC/SapB family protein [Patescibacteria group bacterium]|nr:MgtC/SapB family protein [Patescibacteria group bacterium]
MSDVFTTSFALDPLTIAFIFDAALAIALGYLIGGERELRNKDAGISTHIFVISGAMLFTFMSMTVDPASKSRIAAQIVSGIGFLGAGLILKDGGSVKNLTTAASIWFAGAIGMAIGFGYHQIAIVAGLASVFIPRIPHVRPKRSSPSTPSTKPVEDSEEASSRVVVDD